jgi:hypothetical protein
LADYITQVIITKAYQAIPDHFLQLYQALLDIGHYPTCWKQAVGIILKKLHKLDYSLPKAYRVISLLNYLGKVSKRILAQRLAYLAETSGLLYNSQIKGRLKKSTINTALLLINKIEANKRLKYKTIILFLDVKGAFDHISKNRLLSILKKLRLLFSLISWILLFLNNRIL